MQCVQCVLCALMTPDVAMQNSVSPPCIAHHLLLEAQKTDKAMYPVCRLRSCYRTYQCNAVYRQPCIILHHNSGAFQVDFENRNLLLA
jgi:hypothetical protein